MADYDIDRLQIEIEASSNAAVRELQALAESLEALQKALSGANFNGAASDMDKLGDETEGTDKALKDAKDSGLKFGDVLKANILSDAIMSGVRALGNALADIGRGMLDFAKDGIDLASDLEEVQNVVSTTFGDSAAQVDQFAQAAAASFGLSELSAKQFSGTMGAMLSSMGLSDEAVLDMSTSLAGLAGDMASFYNLDPTEAFEKLRSGISGETEPLKQLGINMSAANLEAYALAQGLTTAYSEMSEAEKAALRYSYIMDATAAAQGDFAKTSDSYANQQRVMQLNLENLSASIGEKLLPYLTELTSGLNGLLSGEISVSEFMQNVSETISGIAENLLDNLPVIMEAAGELVGGILSGIRDVFPQLVEVAGEILGNLIDGLASGLPSMMETGAEMLVTLVTAIADSLPELIPTIVGVALSLVETLTKPDVLVSLIDAGLKLIIGLAEGLVKAVPELIRAIPTIVKNLVSSLIESAPKILAAGVQLVVTLGAGLVEAIPELVANIPKVIAAIVGGITSGISKIIEVGKNIVSGLWEGIKSMGAWIKEKVSGLFSGMVDGVKNLLGIHSPSRVFAGIGENMAAGIGKGWGAEIGGISNSISRSVSGLIPDLSASVSVGVARPAFAAAGLSSGWNSISAESIPTAKSVLHNPTAQENNGAADIINAVMAMGNMIVKAVNDKDSNSYLDGHLVSRYLYDYNQQVAKEHGGSLVKR